jgi:hypothetical protein
MPQMTIKVDDSKVRTLMHNAVLAVESIPKKVMRPIMLEAKRSTGPALLAAPAGSSAGRWNGK